MRNTKRTISVLLALTMVVSLFPVMPVTVFAEEYAPPFGELSGGKYTLESDWYQLTEDFAVFHVKGGTVTGNFADLAAGGIYNCDSATLNMDGSPVIKDNANGNLWLGGDSVITIGQFLSGAAIDVRADNMTESRAITAGFNNGNCDMFSFSYGATQAKLDNNGEVIPDVAETVTVYTWDELILLSDKTL